MICDIYGYNVEFLVYIYRTVHITEVRMRSWYHISQNRIKSELKSHKFRHSHNQALKYAFNK